MAKKVPCASCGELRWPSTHAGAPAVPTCRSCRSAAAEHGSGSMYRRGCRCEVCRSKQHARAVDYQRRVRVPAARECAVCSSTFAPRANQITCSPECRKIHLGRLGDHRSRATYFGVEYEPIDRCEVFARDSWTCGICSLPVDPSAKFPAPGAATLDHIVAMSRGGGHTLSNVQLAHFYCNTSKGAKAQEAVAC